MTKKKFKCGLCGKIRRVMIKPKSKCSCRVDFPNKHMYVKYIIRDTVEWTWQEFMLLFRRTWKRIK